MAKLNYLGVSSFNVNGDNPIISDILWLPETNTVYTSSGAFGWIASWDWDGSALDHQGQVALLEEGARSGTARLAAVSVDGGYYVSAAGGAVDGVEIYQSSDSGVGDLIAFGAEFGDLANVVWIEDRAETTIVAIDENTGALTLWTADAEGTTHRLDNVFLTADGDAAVISDVAQFAQNGTNYVAAIDQAGNTVTLLDVTDDGFGTAVQVGNKDGLPISRPTGIEVVDFNGETFLVVAGSGSNSISIIAVNNGTLELRDQVIDDRDTRFDGIGVLETITFEGRAYIAASGQDSGFTIFTILPGGRLLSVATLEDRIGAPLEDITAMEFAVQDGGLHLLVTGEGWDGISVLEVDTGSAGSVQIGTNGGGFAGWVRE